MADYYADSSVLVKRHVNEIGSGWFRAIADPAVGNVIITSRVSIIEVYSAFNLYGSNSPQLAASVYCMNEPIHS